MTQSIVPIEYAIGYRLTHSYREFVEHQYLKRNIDLVVQKNIRELVGSVEEIYERNAIALRSEIEDGVQQTNHNLETITLNLEDIADTLDVINSNVVSGFQALFVKADEINSSLSHLNRSVEALIDIARTPAQTWALNQFDIARDLMRRKLFPETLEAVNLAINGNSLNTGYKFDHRFHQLRGTILLGIPGEPDSTEILDLKAAEEAFVAAARYARSDYPMEAALAYVGAGKAAYADERLKDAEKNYLEALGLNQLCGEANYQLSRLRMHAGDTAQMEEYLARALNIHWSFALRAANDAVFESHVDFVQACIVKVSKRIESEIDPRVKTIIADVDFLKEKRVPNYSVYTIAQYEFDRLDREVTKISQTLESKQLKNVFEARLDLPGTMTLLAEVVKKYCNFLEACATSANFRSSMATSLEGPRVDPEDQASKISTIVCVIAVLAFLVWAYFAAVGENHGGGGVGVFIFFILYVVIAGIPFGAVLSLVTLGVYNVMKSNIREGQLQAERDQRHLDEQRVGAVQNELARTLTEVRSRFGIRFDLGASTR